MKELLAKMMKLVKSGKLNKDGSIALKDNRSYQIRTEEAVLNFLRPLFFDVGLLPIVHDIECMFVNSTTIKVKVLMRVYDIDSGEYLQFAGIGSGLDKGDKDAGKAFTYAFRNALQKLVMMVSGEDSDRHSSESLLQDLKTEGVMLCERLWKLNAFHAGKEAGDTVTDEVASTRYQKRVALIDSLSSAAELTDILGTMRAKESELSQK